MQNTDKNILHITEKKKNEEEAHITRFTEEKLDNILSEKNICKIFLLDPRGR